jgi:two-component system response regulator NreC
MTARIRVLLVEDHAVVREGLRSLFGGEPDLTVVGEASSGEEALGQARSLAPDVIVMDVGLGGIDGIETTRRLAAAEPARPVVILSMHDDAATVDRAFRAGARGYVLKGAGFARLCDAVRSVHRGEVYLSPDISEYVLQGYLTRSAQEVDPLTDREREVLRLIAEGLTSAEIAARLGLKPKTVENHRGHIMEKLDIHTTAGLVRYAMRRGIAS